MLASRAKLGVRLLGTFLAPHFQSSAWRGNIDSFHLDGTAYGLFKMERKI